MSDSSGKRRGLPRRLKMRHDTHFVEDLTVRHEEPVGRVLAVDLIETDPGQPRGSMGDLSDLVDSIREKGVLEPILIRPTPHDENQEASAADGRPPYRIISGERRYLAALEAGFLEIPVIEMEVSEEEALEIALVENLQRKDLTPFEEAEGYRRLAEQHGYTHDRIAEAVGKSRTAVTESLSLLQMAPRARDTALALGLTSKSLLLEVVKRTSDEDETIAMLERVADLGWSRDDLRRQVRRGDRRTGRGATSARRKPYTFRFKSPDKTFQLSLSFRRSTVDREDVVAALEQILRQLQTRSDGAESLEV